MKERLQEVVVRVQNAVELFNYVPTLESLNLSNGGRIPFDPKNLLSGTMAMTALGDIGMRLEHLTQFINSEENTVFDIPKNADGKKSIILFLTQIQGKVEFCAEKLDSISANTVGLSMDGTRVNIRKTIDEIIDEILNETKNFIQYAEKLKNN